MDVRVAAARTRLWNEAALSQLYANDRRAFQAAVLQQYSVYVEMADRSSQRRVLANTFFLTLNTANLTLIGIFWRRPPHAHAWWLVIPLIAVLGQCFAWYSILRSYRSLNSAKYQVIGAFEELLPASPYWRAEWSILGEGKDPTRYWPPSHIEQWIPPLFVCLYVTGFIAIFLARS